MTSSRRDYPEGAAGAAAVLLLAALTVNRYSPEHLNADVILQSIISLQNITLFYWGQNRLVNLLPFLSAAFRDPARNLGFVLMAGALAHYGAVYLLSSIAVAYTRGPKSRHQTLFVFLVVSFVLAAVTRNTDPFSLVVMHPEYPLPLLLALLVFRCMASRWLGLPAWLALAVPSLFLATGLNPSIVFVSLGLLAGLVIYEKRVRVPVRWHLALSLGCFLAWHFITKEHGDAPFMRFRIALVPEGLSGVMVSLATVFPLQHLVAVAALSFALRGLLLLQHRPVSPPSRAESFTKVLVGLFCLSWLVLFSSNEWIEANRFNYRYFTFVIYAVLALFSLFVSKTLSAIPRFSYSVAGAAAFASVVSLLWHPYTPLREYRVLQSVDALPKAPTGLYAGDYWLVWPAVFSEMLSGRSSYGLTLRGEGNQDAVKSYVRTVADAEGRFPVMCLSDSATNCRNQVARILDPVVIEKVIQHGELASELILSNSAQSLIYRAHDFALLPATTGAADSGSRRSNGSSGYLFFGPYIKVREGRYRLTVWGSARRIVEAVVDVVSRNGSDVHARYRVTVAAAGTELLSKAAIELPAGINDLEVRFFVSDRDDVEVTGYELRPE